MIAEFTHTITIGDDEFEVDVEYRASKYSDCVEVDDFTVTLDGKPIDLTPEQDKAILEACLDRIDDDFQGYADAEGDYRYEMSRDDY